MGSLHAQEPGVGQQERVDTDLGIAQVKNLISHQHHRQLTTPEVPTTCQVPTPVDISPYFTEAIFFLFKNKKKVMLIFRNRMFLRKRIFPLHSTKKIKFLAFEVEV